MKKKTIEVYADVYVDNTLYRGKRLITLYKGSSQLVRDANKTLILQTQGEIRKILFKKYSDIAEEKRRQERVKKIGVLRKAITNNSTIKIVKRCYGNNCGVVATFDTRDADEARKYLANNLSREGRYALISVIDDTEIDLRLLWTTL